MMIEHLKPLLLVIVIQMAYSVMNILLKMAALDGMSVKVLVAYRYIFATAFIAPIAFILERNKRPKLTWSIIIQASLCGFFGGLLSQNMNVEAIKYTSATFVAAINNLIPAVTFILAVCFRLEKLNLKVASGKAKVGGTIVGIGGAMLLTFFKGPKINLWSTHLDLLHRSHTDQMTKTTLGGSSEKLILGCVLSIGAVIAYAMWIIVQTKMSSKYPCHYSSTALASLSGAVQCVIYALCAEKDWNQWKLKFDIRLLTAVYTGVVTNGLVVALIAWCVVKKGPLYLTSFSPLSVVLVAIAGSLVLNETLYLGSILGAGLIVMGLYMVVWGKGEEEDMDNKIKSLSENSEKYDQSVDITVVSSGSTYDEDNRSGTKK